jgi:type I restriction enzyme M protein
LGCDVLLTNPPFAGDIDEFDLLEAYEAQQGHTSKKAVSREHLFLERAVDLLRPGGRLAIVVPQGILANSTASYLRTWLIRKCRILAVVGLHQHTFTPYTGVKTAILFLTKPEIGKQPPTDYPILFAISSESGKDSSGRNIGDNDFQLITAALNKFMANQGFEWAQDHNPIKAQQAVVEQVALSEILKNDRLDAEHYDPVARALERSLSSLSEERIGDAIEPRIARFKKQNYSEITYIDISSVDNRTGLSFPETIKSEEAPSRASYLVEHGDVLVSTVRPDRNVVAMITTAHEAPPVASNGFCVLRAKDIPPELLFAYCKTDAFKRMLTMHSTASMYPTVSDKDVLSVPFIRPPKEIEENVVELIKSGLLMIERAQKQIHSAIQVVDEFVETARNEIK